jgi:hypothetical protein
MRVYCGNYVFLRDFWCVAFATIPVVLCLSVISSGNKVFFSTSPHPGRADGSTAAEHRPLQPLVGLCLVLINDTPVSSCPALGEAKMRNDISAPVEFSFGLLNHNIGLKLIYDLALCLICFVEDRKINLPIPGDTD